MLLPVLAALLAAPELAAPDPGTIYIGPATFCLSHETADRIAAEERSGRSGRDLYERDNTCGSGCVQVMLVDRLGDFSNARGTRYWYWKARSIADGSSMLYVFISLVEQRGDKPVLCGISA